MNPLNEAFDFTPDELAANRAGRLSDAQRAALMKVLGRVLDRQRPLPVVGLAGLVIGVGLLATAALRIVSRATPGGIGLLIGLGLLVTGGGAALLAGRSASPGSDPAAVFNDQIRDERIEVLRGSVRLTQADALLVGEEMVTYLTRPRRSAADALHDDRIYTAYTIEITGTRVLLSLEESTEK
jgi:hypothetical protein